MTDDDLVKLFKAVGHKTRFAMIKELQNSAKGLQPSYFSELFKTTMPTISFHLSKLENVGLVKTYKRSNNVVYKTNPETLKKIKL